MAVIGTSDLDVFPLALGGNTFGWTSDATESEAVLDAFVAAGGNFVDTADGYSSWAPGNVGGESELILGEWMRQRGNRDSIVIGTKVGQHPDFPGLSAGSVSAGADASLERLGTDYIDLYYAHFDDEETELEETVSAFNNLVVAGKVRHVAISNYTAERAREWIAISQRNGFALPVAIQPPYNLVNRTVFEGERAALAAEFSLGVLPYSGLASGFLTGKYRTAADTDGKARGSAASRYLTDHGLAVIDQLESVASEQGASMATTALAWLLSRPGVVAPIASARVPEQLGDLMAAPTLTLTAEQLNALDEVSAMVAA